MIFFFSINSINAESYFYLITTLSFTLRPSLSLTFNKTNETERINQIAISQNVEL